MAKVSIVILNFNGRHFLEKFLPSIIKYSEGHEIVVADNNSSDDSISLLKNSFPEVRLIILDENYGFCGGYNRALAQLNSDFFVIINSDVEVTENWINPVLELFEHDEKIAAIQPKLLDYNFKDKFEYAGGAGGFIDKYGYPFCRGRIFDTIETDIGQYDDNSEIFWATGACFFIRAELFKSFGGFDEDFFAHMEEIDLCWRMKSEGFKVFHCGESVVYHVGGGTLSYFNPRKTYLNFRNSLLLLIKNLPVTSLIWKLPFRWLVDYVAVLKFLISGNIKDAFMVIKAHIYVWKNLIKTLKKRKSQGKTTKNLTGVFPKLLLFHYYIFRKKRFGSLNF
jgi:GT2 family glycosyltransferase